MYVVDAEGKREASFAPVINATLQGPDAVFALLRTYLQRLAITQADQVLFIADGAPWIWKRVPLLVRALGLTAERVHELLDFYRVCPTFYTWRFYRVVRLTRPTVLREPYGAKSNLPSACSPPLGGGTLVLCLAGMSGRLSIIVPCRYPLRHVSHGKPTVVKGGRWR